MSSKLGWLALLAGVVQVQAAPTTKSALPIVDLGYEKHQAISLESGIYNFSNIRYAAPPVGELRFRAPVSPSHTKELQTGNVGRVCPQADPDWAVYIATQFVTDYLYGIPYTGPTNESTIPYTALPLDPRTDEDCLFLDVLTPQQLFDGGKGEGKGDKKAPVMVWIYGGGYTEGDKSAYDGAPLIQRSLENGGEPIVYVALNYRLGAFGWLAGREVEVDGVANAALHDQRFALDWVKQNIHLFGGDPERITVFGESAGGGSILHQITAYGGQGPRPAFNRAILQSPGFLPVNQESHNDEVANQFLEILGVKNLEEARKLPSSKLIAANAYQVGFYSNYGSFTYGPAIDGIFVPDLPGKLLLEGRFYRDIEVMNGHNADEGLDFTSPTTVTEAGIRASLEQNLDGITTETINYILDVLYPAVFDGTYPYKDSVGRAALMNSELAFECNTDYLNRALNNQTYTYEFSIPPALHGEDVPYTFFTGTANSEVLNQTVAYAMQDYFTSFAATGKPVSALGPVFPIHGNEAREVNFGLSTISVTTDNTANQRCRWWQHAYY